MLVAKAKLTDRQLEPTDNTKLIVTVFNASPIATARNVKATAALANASVEGLQLVPDDRDFGTIEPNGRSTREFSVATERAKVGKHKVLLNLRYDYSVPSHECEQEEFDVVED
jgi:hypothetical protein